MLPVVDFAGAPRRHGSDEPTIYDGALALAPDEDELTIDDGRLRPARTSRQSARA